MPRRPRSHPASDRQEVSASVRSIWSGTITFGLVSIPVDLLAAVRPRLTAMKLVDPSGHPLGREYRCSKEGKKLGNDELIRGYETDSGKMLAITDAELESVAPEKSGDIELRSFVPLEQIPPLYFQRPYFLAPAGKSTKAYHLLAAIMERTGRVGIGSFVMREHEYLVAIVSDNGVLRADTLRYADELRTPKAIGIAKAARSAARKEAQFAKEIDELTRKDLDASELTDADAATLQELVQAKLKTGDEVIHVSGLEDADAETEGAKVIDLMDRLRKSLSKKATVTNAESGSVVSLAERRAQRAAGKKNGNKRSSAPRKKRRTTRRARS